MVKTDNIEFLTKCRACLSDPPEMHNIFEEFDQGESLSKILKNLTQFEIEENDGLSPYLCENCTMIVVNFFNLSVVWQENEKVLRTLLCEEDSTLSVSTNVEENEISDKSENACPRAEQDEYFIPTKCKQELCEQFVKNEVPVESNVEYVDKDTNSGYSCEYCGISFLSQKHLQRHKRSKHIMDETSGETESLKCEICQDEFQTVLEFKKHYRVHNKYVCEICGAAFLRISYLNDHLECHRTDRRYICHVCGKAFRVRSVLKKHKRIHTHPRQCVCEICGLRFTAKGTLKTHIKLKHTKERNFHCNICDLWFPLKGTLSKHVLRHNEAREKTFTCNICHSAYKDKSSLNRHVIVKHTSNSKQFGCNLCHKRYTTRANLSKHTRLHHSTTTESNQDAESS